MTGLRMWLAGVLNRHIERHNLEPFVERVIADARQQVPTSSRPELPDLAAALVEATRPCWACGSPLGFHAIHRPCWNVLPFKRDTVPVMRTYGDGGLL